MAGVLSSGAKQMAERGTCIISPCANGLHMLAVLLSQSCVMLPMLQGVKDHCLFFKSIEDASSLRRRVSECFERAALPMTPESERKRLLSFVVCGGGPTGVEVAAELHDMVFEDLKVWGGGCEGGQYTCLFCALTHQVAHVYMQTGSSLHSVR